ncbi:MAG: hypothetical protein KGL44_11065 [Sphingomonadales bacterium]|nr:hypothetical protein [Sphingomonadales bacterium]
MAALLPQGYEALEPFVEQWALEGSQVRTDARSNSTPEQRQAFFDAANPLLAEGLDMLDAKPLAALDAAEKRLLNLFLSLAHVGMAVEVHGPDEGRHATLRAHMPIVRSTADRAA